MFRPDKKGLILIAMQSLQFPFPSSRCPIRQDLSWNITISLHFSPFTNKPATTRNSHKFHSCETHKCCRLCWETIGTETKSLLQTNYVRTVSNIELATHLLLASLPTPWPRNYWLYTQLQIWHLDRCITVFFLFLYCLFTHCLNFCCNTYSSRVGIT